jgi:ubiquinone/menaquinone biosynthesis C-methylase UbiE
MDPNSETLHSWNKVARLYQELFMDLDLYNNTYDSLCSVLPHKARILEIGCGPGNITKYLLHKKPDLVIEAIDNSVNMIELARKNNPTAQFNVMDCRDIDIIHTQFDAIVCGFCLPYLSDNDCFALFNDCKKRLVSGGLLYISFVEGAPALSGYQTGSSGDRMFFYYHELQAFLTQLQVSGFKAMQQFNVDYTKKDGTMEMHTILIVQA